MTTAEFRILTEMHNKIAATDEILKYAMKYFKSVDTYGTSVRTKKISNEEIRFYVDKEENEAKEILEPFFMYLLSYITGEEDDETYDLGIKIFSEDKVVKFLGKNGNAYKAFTGQEENYYNNLQIYPYFLSISIL